MFTITATINKPNSEVTVAITPEGAETNSLEEAISQVISANPDATSFVFVVARKPLAMEPMTLDDAKGYFDNEPSDKTCGQYLEVASKYWADEMIEDTTYYQIVTRVAEWLCDK